MAGGAGGQGREGSLVGDTPPTVASWGVTGAGNPGVPCDPQPRCFSCCCMDAPRPQFLLAPEAGLAWTHVSSFTWMFSHIRAKEGPVARATKSKDQAVPTYSSSLSPPVLSASADLQRHLRMSVILSAVSLRPTALCPDCVAEASAILPSNPEPPITPDPSDNFCLLSLTPTSPPIPGEDHPPF